MMTGKERWALIQQGYRIFRKRFVQKLDKGGYWALVEAPNWKEFGRYETEKACDEALGELMINPRHILEGKESNTDQGVSAC